MGDQKINNNEKNSENSTNDEFSNDSNNENNREAADHGPHFHGNEPDIGLGDQHPRSYRRNMDNNEGKSNRKEDTLVSFKHFLNSSSNTRINVKPSPDIYDSVSRNNTLEAGPSGFTDRCTGNSDISSALPDFVQDHLAMEQHYFNRNVFPDYGVSGVPNIPYNSSVNNDGQSLNNEISVGDSIQNSNGQNMNRPCRSSLTRYMLANRNNINHSANGNCSSTASVSSMCRNPLDLPTDSNSGQALPFDLTEGSNLNIVGSSSNDSNNSVAAPSHSRSTISRMPDFLADSHIYDRGSRHSRQSGTIDDVNSELSPTNEMSRLENENTRLRQIISNLQRLFADQSIRLQQAEGELKKMKANSQLCCKCSQCIAKETPSTSYSSPSTSGTNRSHASITLEQNTNDALDLVRQLQNTLNNLKITSRNLNNFPDQSFYRIQRQDDSDSSD